MEGHTRSHADKTLYLNFPHAERPASELYDRACFGGLEGFSDNYRISVCHRSMYMLCWQTCPW